MRSNGAKNKTGFFIPILENVAVFGGVVFAYAFNQLFGAPRTVVGWALVVILSMYIKYWDIQWIAYSVIFWACDLSQDDNFALIAVTTLMFGAITTLSIVLPDHKFNGQRQQFLNIVRFFASFPISCNNLLFHTGLGIIRFTLFHALDQSGYNRRKMTGIYILFAKSEALVPLIIWHIIIQCAHTRMVLHPSLIETDDNTGADTNSNINIDAESGYEVPESISIRERVQVI